MSDARQAELDRDAANSEVKRALEEQFATENRRLTAHLSALSSSAKYMCESVREATVPLPMKVVVACLDLEQSVRDNEEY